ncbi:MAG: hypothetical protein QOI95_1852, partial [Acidimicrobiaceae bacterium]
LLLQSLEGGTREMVRLGHLQIVSTATKPPVTEGWVAGMSELG